MVVMSDLINQYTTTVDDSALIWTVWSIRL